MERGSAGKEFGSLLTVETVQVVQTISVPQLESILSRIHNDLAELAAGPRSEDVQSLKEEIGILGSEIERIQGENRQQIQELIQHQVFLLTCPKIS